jgi:cytoskeleton protein RodZ
MGAKREPVVSIFQRIKAPFTEAVDEPAAAAPRPRPVGELLREQRQELGLDINDVGEVLRIKPAFLEALEENRPQDLPGPTYVLGFVRAYARHLGLDDEWVLERYKAESAGVQARPDLAFPAPLGERSLPGGPVLLVALILAICGYGTWYYLSTGERARPERVSAVPPALQIPPPEQAAAGGVNTNPPALAAAADPAPAAKTPANSPNAAPANPPTVAPTPTANAPGNPANNPRLGSGLFPGSAAATTSPNAAAGLPADATAAPAKTPVPEPAGATTTSAAPQTAAALPGSAPSNADSGAAAGRIDIKATADCWVQIRGPDQSIVFSRVLKTGETYRVPARSGLVLRTGNAGALTIAVDGKQVPAIGPLGALRRNVVLEPAALTGGTAVQG